MAEATPTTSTGSGGILRREVSPLELFFDLVFVLAVSQLTRHLVERLDWRGIAETLTLLTEVFGVWVYASFVATLFDVRHRATQTMLVVLMGLGLFMNAGIATAFDDAPWLFIVPLVLAVGSLSVGTALFAPAGVLRSHFTRVLLWFVASGSLWILGAFFEQDTRLALWAVAALINLTGTFTGFPLPGRTTRTVGLDFDAMHMIERLRLFLIVLLGESVMAIGLAITDHHNEAWSLVAAAGSFVTVVLLYLSYFANLERMVRSRADASDDPIRQVHLGIIFMWVVLVALVAFAVGAETVIAHPTAVSAGARMLELGAGLYLAAQAAYLAASRVGGWLERLAGAGILGLAAALTDAAWPVVDLAIVIAVLGSVLALGARRQAR